VHSTSANIVSVILSKKKVLTRKICSSEWQNQLGVDTFPETATRIVPRPLHQSDLLKPIKQNKERSIFKLTCRHTDRACERFCVDQLP